MAKYTIAASVTVDVEMAIEAASAKEAMEIFENQIAMSAFLTDTPKSEYDVHEDSISDVQRVTVEAG